MSDWFRLYPTTPPSVEPFLTPQFVDTDQSRVNNVFTHDEPRRWRRVHPVLLDARPQFPDYHADTSGQTTDEISNLRLNNCSAAVVKSQRRHPHLVRRRRHRQLDRSRQLA